MRALTLSAAVVPALSCVAAFADEPQPKSHPANTGFDSLRARYLRDIHLLRDYRPGKNSFVEGPDRRLGRYTAPLWAGENEVVVQLTSFCNVNFNWAGFALREVQ